MSRERLSPQFDLIVTDTIRFAIQFATLVCVFTLDRIGRRWTLYWGSVGQGIAMFLAGGFSRLAINAKDAGNTHKASQYGAAAASMIFLFTSVFGATWLTVPWIYPAEIWYLPVRARGNALGVVGWSIGNGWLVSSVSMGNLISSYNTANF